MNRIRNTSQRLVEVLVFYRKKNIKLQPVTPLMPLEALLIPVNPTNSDYDGINGGTGCNFIYFITVPTTCSRPSIEMVGFITVPTTCSRPSIEMVGFIYYCADYL